MGKKTKKLAKEKQAIEADSEDYSWLNKPPAKSAISDAIRSSGKLKSVAPVLVSDSKTGDSSPSISCSLGSEDSASSSREKEQNPNSSASSPGSISQVSPLIDAGLHSIAGNITASNIDVICSPPLNVSLGDKSLADSSLPEAVASGSGHSQPAPLGPNSPVVHKQNSWANLFKSNRKPENVLMLSEWIEDSEEITLSSDDVDIVEKSWGYGLIGYVAGKFPGKGAIDQCCKSWGVKVQLHFHSSGWLLFKFSSSIDRDAVLNNGPFYIFGRPLLLKVMPDEFDFNDCEINKVPVWVQLPNLPLEYWNVRALSKIASKLGTPKQADKLTISRDRVSFARVLVEIDVSKPLKEEVLINAPSGKKILQSVRYEYIPKYCTACKAIGHLNDRCPYSALPNSSSLGNSGSVRPRKGKQAVSKGPGTANGPADNQPISEPVANPVVDTVKNLTIIESVLAPSQAEKTDILEEGFTVVSKKAKGKAVVQAIASHGQGSLDLNAEPSRKGKGKSKGKVADQHSIRKGVLPPTPP